MRTFLLILSLLVSINSYSQTILKGKQITPKLKEIESLLNQGKFQEATNIFESKIEIITFSNVRKDDIPTYRFIERKIQNQKNEYEQNAKLIKEWKNISDRDKLFDAFNFKLKKENFYEIDYSVYNEIYKSLTTWINQKIVDWNSLYNNQEKEKLLNIFKNNIPEELIEKHNITIYQELSNNIAKFEADYNKLKKEYIEEPRINYLNINVYYLSYGEANRALVEINSFLENSNVEKLSSLGNVPILKEKFIEIQEKLNSKKTEIQNIIKEKEESNQIEFLGFRLFQYSHPVMISANKYEPYYRNLGDTFKLGKILYDKPKKIFTIKFIDGTEWVAKIIKKTIETDKKSNTTDTKFECKWTEDNSDCLIMITKTINSGCIISLNSQKIKDTKHKIETWAKMFTFRTNGDCVNFK